MKYVGYLLCFVLTILFSILFILMVYSCSTPLYKQVSEPTFKLREVIRNKPDIGQGIPRIYFTVANPTLKNKTFKIECCVVYELDNCVSTTVKVPARSDKIAGVYSFNEVTCSLLEL